MRTSILIAGAAAVLIAAVESRDAYACGGCVAGPSSSTQVSGHRMILSVSQAQTTLWDQLEYAGDASEFAWVLPIHGQVDIGLSSDLLFGTLDQLTDPVVFGGSCGFGGCAQGTGTGATSGAFMSSGTGVTVIAQEVVGPYETVQLQSSDPTALQTWLDAHGYVVPADVQSVVAQYVNEGFDFLAMRLVPGQGTSAMRPVRITSPGAGLTLPLRMVAVGSGAITPIKLWIFGEGRYEPTNAPTFLIDPGKVTYDYTQGLSNMSTLRTQAFAASNNLGWLVNGARHYYDYEVFGSIQNNVDFDAAASGYGDDALGTNAPANFAADKDALIGGINGGGNFYITRLDAQLSRDGLKNDLALGASANQTDVSNFFQATNAPVCPPPPDCSNGAGTANGPSGGGPSGGASGGSGGMSGSGLSGGGCSTSGGPGTLAGLIPAALALALVTARRRASPSRAARARRPASRRADPRA